MSSDDLTVDTYPPHMYIDCMRRNSTSLPGYLAEHTIMRILYTAVSFELYYFSFAFIFNVDANILCITHSTVCPSFLSLEAILLHISI